MAIWVATNVKAAHGLSAKIRRRGGQAVVKGRDVYILRSDGRKPWAELAGHMTTATQVEPVSDSDPMADKFDQWNPRRSNPPSGFIPCKAVKITRNKGKVEVRIRK